MALVPVSGEVIPFDAPSDVLVDAIYRIRDLESRLASARRDLGLEITRRMDADNLRQVDVDGFRVTVAKPAEDWDMDRLDEVLDELVAAEIITRAAVDRLFKVERKIQKRELTKLLSNLDEEPAAAIRACSERSRRLRSVRVEDLTGERGWSR